MTFSDWIFSRYPLGSITRGQWQFPHILTLCICVVLAVFFALFFKKKSKNARTWVIKGLVIGILVLELARRIINYADGDAVNFFTTLFLILPRPWEAISAWLLIASVFVDKKFMYNFAAINALLCAVIFFAYPTTGFNHRYLLFENWYSILSHSLLLVTSVTLISLGFTDFRYKRDTFKNGFMGELIGFGALFAYALIEIFLLKIASDPMGFMPKGDWATLLGLPYGVFLLLYFVALCAWVNAFYGVSALWRKWKRKKAA